MANTLPSIRPMPGVIIVHRSKQDGFIDYLRPDGKSIPLELHGDVFKIRESFSFQLQNALTDYDIIKIYTEDNVPTYQLISKPIVATTSSGGGSRRNRGVNVKNQGTPIGQKSTFNFTGAGVTAVNVGNGQVNIIIPGGGDSCFEPGTGAESCQQVNTIAPNDASGLASLATGAGTEAAGDASFTQGAFTKANGDVSMATGFMTEANGGASFAGGISTQANGEASIALGGGSIANGDRSMAIGGSSIANGIDSFAGGNDGSEANGSASFAFGKASIADADNSAAFNSSQAEGIASFSMNAANAKGDRSLAQGDASISEARASVAFGTQSKSQYDSSFARASGGFGDLEPNGTAQAEHVTERTVTLDDAPGELFIDGAALRLVLPDKSSWKFTIDLVGVAVTTGDTLVQQWQGGIKRNGATTLVGAATIILSNADAGAAGWIVTVTADVVNNSLKITAQGSPGAGSIRWVADIHLVQVKYT